MEKLSPGFFCVKLCKKCRFFDNLCKKTRNALRHDMIMKNEGGEHP